MATALSAIANASRRPAAPEAVVLMLRTGDGAPEHLRALFGDVPTVTLVEIASAAGLSFATLAAAYRRARALHAAGSADADAAFG